MGGGRSLIEAQAEAAAAAGASLLTRGYDFTRNFPPPLSFPIFHLAFPTFAPSSSSFLRSLQPTPEIVTAIQLLAVQETKSHHLRSTRHSSLPRVSLRTQLQLGAYLRPVVVPFAKHGCGHGQRWRRSKSQGISFSLAYVFSIF